MKKYEIRKTIRFRLTHTHFQNQASEGNLPTGENSFTISKKRLEEVKSFVEEAHDIQKAFKDLILVGKENKEHDFVNGKIKVHYNWLRQYCTYDFYEARRGNTSSKSPKIYSILDFPFVCNRLLNLIKNNISEEDKKNLYNLKGLDLWYYNWDAHTRKLDQFLAQSQSETDREVRLSDKQIRRSEFSELIQFYKTRGGIEFIEAFYKAVHNSNDTNIDKKLEDGLKKLQQFKQTAETVYKEFLPYQRHGVLIKKATLNYNTLNKTPKDLPEQEKKLINKKEKPISEVSNEIHRHLKRYSEFLELKKDGIIQTIFEKKLGDYSLDEIYNKIKTWKADQKNEFTKKVEKKELNKANFKEQFTLFTANEEHFDSFQQKTEEIQSLAHDINMLSQHKNRTTGQAKELKKKRDLLTNIKKKRGAFFNKPGERSAQTPNYKHLCEFYKKVATKRGVIKAQLVSIEKDKRESQMLTHWAVVYEENKQHGVLLFPRQGDQYKKVEKHISKLCDPSGDVTLYVFKSLTLRALEKLCFKRYENTFVTKKLKDALENKKINFPCYKQKLADEELIKLYQGILKDGEVDKNLKLADFGQLEEKILKQSFTGENCVNEFRTALEKYCYVKKIIKVSAKEKGRLINDFHADNVIIDSYDLKKEMEYDKKGERWDNFKSHTQIWKSFWKHDNENAHYPVRLNPELSIFCREATRSHNFYKEKYGKDFDDKKAQNRRLKPQYTLATSITENAPGNVMQAAFEDPKTVWEQVEKFNRKYNNELLKDKWNITYLGIDRGQNELATLCVTKFTDDKYETPNKKEKFNTPKFTPITAWYLKEDKYNFQNEKGRIAIKNLSYFLEKGKEPCTDLFEKTENACIDMTMAKVIKGHIILNGDLTTYFKLKMLAAKRKIQELWDNGRIDGKYQLNPTKANNIRFVKDGDKGIENIYSPSPEQRRASRFKVQENGEPLYFKGSDERNPNFRGIASKVQAHTGDSQKIQDELQGFFEKLKQQKNTHFGIEKINHLRDAIAANMVGVIAHVYAGTNRKCIIELENLATKEINKHFEASHVHISRRLEWALYKRFQSEGMVPPALKETVLMRETSDKTKKVQAQYGIITFVKPEGTSSDCPYCTKTCGKTGKHFICKDISDRDKEKATGKSGKNTKAHNWQIGKGCTFYSGKESNRFCLQPLSNPDKVAAYNIAKISFYETFQEAG